MDNIAIIKSTSQYLSTRLINSIKENTDILLSEYEYNINQLETINSETVLMILFVDGETSFRSQSLVFIKDKSIEHEIPIIVACYEEEQNKIERILSGADIFSFYVHPIDMKLMLDDALSCAKSDKQEKKKILMIDDDGMYCQYVKKVLENEPYTFLFETSGLSAVTRMASIKPDLILLDYQMPKLNGLTLFSCIKDEPEINNIPIIFLTGNNDANVVRAILSLKPNGYLLKSMEPERFVQEISDFFMKRRANVAERKAERVNEKHNSVNAVINTQTLFQSRQLYD